MTRVVRLLHESLSRMVSQEILTSCSSPRAKSAAPGPEVPTLEGTEAEHAHGHPPPHPVSRWCPAGKHHSRSACHRATQAPHRGGPGVPAAVTAGGTRGHGALCPSYKQQWPARSVTGRVAATAPARLERVKVEAARRRVRGSGGWAHCRSRSQPPVRVPWWSQPAPSKAARQWLRQVRQGAHPRSSPSLPLMARLTSHASQGALSLALPGRWRHKLTHSRKLGFSSAHDF